MSIAELVRSRQDRDEMLQRAVETLAKLEGKTVEQVEEELGR